MHAGVGVVFGHGLVIDLILSVGAVMVAGVVNASQANSDEQRVRGQRVLRAVAAVALAVPVVPRSVSAVLLLR